VFLVEERASLSSQLLRRVGQSLLWFLKWAVAPLILGALAIAGGVALYRQGIDFDTFLNYFALGLLIFVIITLFYGIIAIHDVPYEIAHRRNHPHQDAIHAAGWVSLFTLHALWPFLWIWAMLYRPERGWGFAHGQEFEAEAPSKLDDLFRRLEKLEARVQRAEATVIAEAPARRPKRVEPAPVKELETAAKEEGA
jgi:Protein of unknown function (DUF3302)